MKAFFNAVIVLVLISVAAAFVLSAVPNSSQDVYATQNVRL